MVQDNNIEKLLEKRNSLLMKIADYGIIIEDGPVYSKDSLVHENNTLKNHLDNLKKSNHVPYSKILNRLNG